MKFKAQTKEIDGEKWLKFDSKFEEYRYYQGNKIMFWLGILIIIFMAILGYVLFTHISELSQNPFVYGLSKLNVEASCQCSVPQGYKPFWVNTSAWGYGTLPSEINLIRNLSIVDIQGKEFDWGAYNETK